MKFKKLTIITTSLLTLICSVQANNKLEDQSFIDKYSYAMGYKYAVDMKSKLEFDKNYTITYNTDRFLTAFNNVFNNKPAELTEKDMNNTLIELSKTLSENMPEIFLKQGKAYMEDYSKQEGVKKTESGLLYKITNPGKGSQLTNEKQIKVNFIAASVIDHKIFGGSEKDKPVILNLEKMPKGFIEGIKLIKTGGEIEMVLPPELAYGKEGINNSVAPNATIMFKVSLVDIIKNVDSSKNKTPNTKSKTSQKK